MDHAAHWETALMLALQPQLTALERLDGQDLTLENTGIIGNNPLLATLGQGRSALLLATERLAVHIRALLEPDSQSILNELYHRRRKFYNDYVNDFFSWLLGGNQRRPGGVITLREVLNDYQMFRCSVFRF